MAIIKVEIEITDIEETELDTYFIQTLLERGLDLCGYDNNVHVKETNNKKAVDL